MFIIINVGEDTLQTYTTPLENNLVKFIQRQRYIYTIWPKFPNLENVSQGNILHANVYESI